MAFSASELSSEPRSYSIGPLKEQILSYSAASGDTSGTATAARLSSVMAVKAISGPLAAAAVSISGNVVSLTFADPLATVTGYITVIGK